MHSLEQPVKSQDYEKENDRLDQSARKAEFRGDAFNLFNRPNLTGFVSDLSNANFGKANTAFNARYFQLAARVTF